MMQKVITVRGQANTKVKPDYVNVLISLETQDMDYSNCMVEAMHRIETLKGALKKANLDADDLRTTNFNVDTEWKWLKDEIGNEKERVFSGYMVRHDFKVGFDFDKNRLIEVLAALANLSIDVEFRVRFTVKDASKVQVELFAKASENARKIAEGLCRGVGKKLGEVININYSWQEIDVYREVGNSCGYAELVGNAPDINPDDLDASDSVVFTWELV